MLADARRLTHEQRLKAFLVHCQLMMKLYAEGQKIRLARNRQPKCDAAANLEKLLSTNK